MIASATSLTTIDWLVVLALTSAPWLVLLIAIHVDRRRHRRASRPRRHPLPDLTRASDEDAVRRLRP